MDEKKLHVGRVSKLLLIINILVGLIYLSWWMIPSNIGNIYLYALLFFGEVYHLLMALLFWNTIWPKSPKVETFINHDNQNYHPSVDIFITVAGEDVGVVYQTALAAKKIIYPGKKIYLLNDGFVRGRDDWQKIEALASLLEVECITRKTPGGAKTGNINNALRKTSGELIVVFDADMKAKSNFLERTVSFFASENVGFVQTPQYYQNYDLNSIAGSAWEQQEFFFGPIMEGKEKSNAVFICGTNVVIRRQALLAVNGMNEKNIAEDFLTSLAIHQKGWRSYYLNEILAEGLAPEDLLSYYKQQLRWCRGSLEVLFSSNPIFKKGLTINQKLEYLSSALFYFSGLVVLIDIIMPILFLFFGLQPVASTTSFFAVFFVPFMFLNLYTIARVSGRHLSFRAISFTQSSFVLQLQALLSIIFGINIKFTVTPKSAQTGNYIFLALPHLIYIFLFITGVFWAIQREGINPSLSTNIAWALMNIAVFLPFIYASFSTGKLASKQLSVNTSLSRIKNEG